MDFEISIEKLKSIIQKLIDSELHSIKEESQEWGLGEMDEIGEINSIEKILVTRVVPHVSNKVYILIYSNDDTYDYQNIRAELQYRVSNDFLEVEFFIDGIIYE